MKSYKLILVFYLAVAGFSANAQCPPWGSAPKGSREGNLNEAKNRSIAKPAKRPTEISLSDVLGNFKMADSTRFHDGGYVYTSGIVVAAQEVGPESYNCNMAKKGSGDVRVFLGLSPDDDKDECMVVEITAAYKKKHKNYAELLNRGARVQVTGYMLWDFEHTANAKNTARTERNVWRKTCWEIHPVTEMKMLKSE